MNEIRIIQSKKGDPIWFRELPSAVFAADEKQEEMELLMVYSDIRRQRIDGFGGALTEAAAYCYDKLDQAHKKELLAACFSPQGLNYNVGRTHIGSCDFSFGNYTYCDQADESLASFSIQRDERYLLPFLRDIMAYCGRQIPIMGSVWSPPAWMKTTGELMRGGALKVQYYPLFAEYLVRYIKAYREQGIEIGMITIQNEAKAVQIWESCVYTAEQERQFIVDYLAPALAKAGIETKIVIWDHNKERAFTRAREIFADPKARAAAAGIAFHWYAGDHFENLRLCREFFPEKELYFTEGCVELALGKTSMAEKARELSGGTSAADEAPWEFGECYAHDMIGNFNHGMNTFMDWNVALDMIGGPNHVGNYCSAPVICDLQRQQLYYQPSYCFIAHMSRYIPAGSYLIAHSSYTSELMSAAFLTPAGEKVAIVLNQTQRQIPFRLKDETTGRIAALTAPEKSITTYLYR